MGKLDYAIKLLENTSKSFKNFINLSKKDGTWKRYKNSSLKEYIESLEEAIKILEKENNE